MNLADYKSFLSVLRLTLGNKSKSGKTDKGTEEQVKNFISDSIIYDIDADVLRECVNLRRRRKIKTPDAIIAATALANGFTIITNNEKDFANIKGLKIINPYKL